MIKGRLDVSTVYRSCNGGFMIRAGKVERGDTRVRLYSYKLYFEEFAYMQAAPDTACRFCRAFDRPPLERFDLGSR